jgi:hypothetical protein
MSSNLNNKINPFDKEEFLTPLLNQDKNFQKAKELFWKNYKQKHLSRPFLSNNTLNSLFYFIENMTQTTLRFLATHIVASILIGLVTFSAITASAAEILAPKELKPTTLFQEIFNNNQQKEKDPYTSLQADTNNNVVKLDECNISLKYPRQVGKYDMGVYYQNQENTDPQGFIRGVTVSSRESIRQLNNFENSQKLRNDDQHPNFLSFGCAKKESSIFKDFNENETVNGTKKDLQDVTSWFVSIERDISNIVLYNVKNAGVYQSVQFDYKDLTYYASFLAKQDKTNAKNGMFATQVQVQFNDLVENKADETIQNTPVQTTDSDKPNERAGIDFLPPDKQSSVVFSRKYHYEIKNPYYYGFKSLNNDLSNGNDESDIEISVDSQSKQKIRLTSLGEKSQKEYDQIIEARVASNKRKLVTDYKNLPYLVQTSKDNLAKVYEAEIETDSITYFILTKYNNYYILKTTKSLVPKLEILFKKPPVNSDKVEVTKQNKMEFQSKIVFVDGSKMKKSVNESAKEGNYTCGREGVMIYTPFYTTGPTSDKEAVITHKNLYNTPKDYNDPRSFEDLTAFINYDNITTSLNPTNSVNNSKVIKDIDGYFAHSCGGYASIYQQDIKDIQVKNADKYRAYITQDGQDISGNLAVKILIQKGDEIILLSNQDVVKGQQYIKTCTGQNNVFSEKCYKEKLYSSENIKTATQKAQELADFFALEK